MEACGFNSKRDSTRAGGGRGFDQPSQVPQTTLPFIMDCITAKPLKSATALCRQKTVTSASVCLIEQAQDFRLPQGHKMTEDGTKFFYNLSTTMCRKVYCQGKQSSKLPSANARSLTPVPLATVATHKHPLQRSHVRRNALKNGSNEIKDEIGVQKRGHGVGTRSPQYDRAADRCCSSQACP